MRVGTSWQQADCTGFAAPMDTLGRCKTVMSSRNRIMADGEDSSL